MTRIQKRLPSPAMIVALIALVLATAGTSYAVGLSKFAKDRMVGVGPLFYATSLRTVSPGTYTDIFATCPGGYHVIGGGIDTSGDPRFTLKDSNPTQTGWAGTLVNNDTTIHFATATAICAKSRVVTGAPNIRVAP